MVLFKVVSEYLSEACGLAFEGNLQRSEKAKLTRYMNELKERINKELFSRYGIDLLKKDEKINSQENKITKSLILKKYTDVSSLISLGYLDEAQRNDFNSILAAKKKIEKDLADKNKFAEIKNIIEQNFEPKEKQA